MSQQGQNLPPSQLDDLDLQAEGLVLMGMPSCGPCSAAASWLDAHGIPHRKIDVSGDYKLILWLRQVTGQRSVPQFFFRGQWLPGGFAQAQQLIMQGALAKPAQAPKKP